MKAPKIVRNYVVHFQSEYIYPFQNGSANISQKKDSELQWCWTKVGQYVQLGVNVFLAYPTLKYLR